jgi:Putative addiction module component
MSTLAEIESAADQLPRPEKLRLMETLWEDLRRQEEGEWASPTWHGEALAQTAQRLVEGAEEVLDWQSTKAELRQKTV